MNNTNANSKRNWDDSEIGSLWLRKTKTNQDILSGKVKVNGTEVEVVGFRNKAKYLNGEVIVGKEKNPDFRLYISEPRDQAPRQQVTNTSPKSAPRQSAPKPAPALAVEDNEIL
jgi:hypothetical protein